MPRPLTLCFVGLLTVSTAAAAEFQLEEAADGVTVKLDGQLLTRYLTKSGAKPILWPIVGPYAKNMTRGYPMREPIGSEKKDHIHHRSLWFTHGDVNGTSFWHESAPHGTIVHRKFLKLSGGEQAVICSSNDWLDPQGKRVCEDIRTFTFHTDGPMRFIDVDIQVKAGDVQVVFGDTKEGSFGMRVAGSMRVELKEGGKILNSEGQQDGDAWGQRAAWVDYSGPVDGQTVGITIMNHPKSFRFPTYWHVRTYGLFAANPFGLHDFLRDKNADGKLVLAPGDTFNLHYRVLLHPGDATSLDLPAAFMAYSATERQ
jgi:hypothetical protein